MVPDVAFLAMQVTGLVADRTADHADHADHISSYMPADASFLLRTGKERKQ